MIKGVDVGGSFVKVLWEDGRKEKHYVKDIKHDKERFIKKLREIIFSGSPSKVGIAVAGFVSKEGKVYHSPNIKVLNGFDFKEAFSDAGVPFVVGNDVNLGAFGEWYYDHRDKEVLLLVAVGTGLGSGLVVKGELFTGACGSALELGHHTIEKDGELCSCGRRGCWEAYCSSYGIEREFKKLSGLELPDYQIAELAKKGDEKALRVVEKFKEYLSLGLMNALHIFNPDCVVLGGGVIKIFRQFLEDLPERVKSISEGLPASCVEITFSKADEFIGARGALAYAKVNL